MKKNVLIIALITLVIGTMLFILTGCGNNNEQGNLNNKEGQKQENITNDNSYKYAYREGELIQIVDKDGNPKQTEFVINGIILVGNRHDYSDLSQEQTGIESLVQKGFNKTGLMSKFYIGEWIEIYMDTDYTGENVEMYLAPHRKVEDWEEMTDAQIGEYALSNEGGKVEYEVPDEENNKYVGNVCTTGDAKEGEYDLLILYKGKLSYFVKLSLTKEPIE